MNKVRNKEISTINLHNFILQFYSTFNFYRFSQSQVQLQNMLGSKFVGYFLEEILDWQKKLSTADAVINAWFEVQRAWIHLESIFIGSEDIRSQLPEESKRFEKIDKDFKVILNK